MKIFKKFLFVAIAAVMACAFVGCKKPENPHECTSKCPTCNLCTDADCLEDACKNKCQGHEDPKPEIAATGLAMEKTKVAYAIGETVNIDDITVKTVNESGEEIETLTSEDYTLSYYKGAEKISSLQDLSAGTYQIWAEKEVEGVSLSNFVLIYVVNSVAQLTFQAEALGTVTSQTASVEDIMSPTWKFTVTYENGDTLTVDTSNENLTIQNLDTATVTESGEATVTYTEEDGKGDVTYASAKVNYTVKEAGAVQSGKIEVNIGNLEDNASITEELELGEGTGVYAVGTSAKTLVIEGNSKTYDGVTYTKRLKLGGAYKASTHQASIKVVTTGAATITVYAISSSSGDTTRTLSIFNGDATEAMATTAEGMPGSALGVATFTVDGAGTYYIGSTVNGVNIYYICVETAGSSAPEPVLPSAVEVNIGNLEDNASITEELELGEDTGVYAVGTEAKALAIEGNEKTYDGVTYSKRLKLGGTYKASTHQASIKVVTTGAATITVYAISGSSSATDRTLSIFNGDETEAMATTAEGMPGSALGVATFTVDGAGTYYIGSLVGALNIYYISVTYA